MKYDSFQKDILAGLGFCGFHHKMANSKLLLSKQFDRHAGDTNNQGKKTFWLVLLLLSVTWTCISMIAKFHWLASTCSWSLWWVQASTRRWWRSSWVLRMHWHHWESKNPPGPAPIWVQARAASEPQHCSFRTNHPQKPKYVEKKPKLQSRPKQDLSSYCKKHQFFFLQFYSHHYLISAWNEEDIKVCWSNWGRQQVTNSACVCFYMGVSGNWVRTCGL